LYKQAFLKRPEHELFDLKKDPYQMKNVAYDSSYSAIRHNLISRMNDYLVETKDPRMIGNPVNWDELPYYKEKDWIGTPRKEAQELFGLKESYSYY
jgi:N-sulfoglucosamine sulfohydrolase